MLNKTYWLFTQNSSFTGHLVFLFAKPGTLPQPQRPLPPRTRRAYAPNSPVSVQCPSRTSVPASAPLPRDPTLARLPSPAHSPCTPFCGTPLSSPSTSETHAPWSMPRATFSTRTSRPRTRRDGHPYAPRRTPKPRSRRLSAPGRAHLGRPAGSPRSSPAPRRTPGRRSSAGSRGLRRSGPGPGSSGPARSSPAPQEGRQAALSPRTPRPLRPGRVPGTASDLLPEGPSPSSDWGADAQRDRP